VNFIPKSKREEIIDKLSKMTDDEFEKTLPDPNSKDDKSKDQEEEPNAEAALRKRIADLESELARLKEELQKFQATDHYIKAIKTAQPHMKLVDNMTRDGQLDLYQSLQKSGLLKDEQSLHDETVRQNEILIADKLENLTTKLINISKVCKVPFNEDSITDMITDWKKSNGVFDNFKVIDFLQKEIDRVIAYLPNKTGDALKKKYGFPNITQDIDTRTPYNSSNLFSADGSKYKDGGNK
jgi:uncharacterized small protein (DUF1192 family)